MARRGLGAGFNSVIEDEAKMADVKLGSKEWFGGLASGLAAAGMTFVTNTLTAKRTAAAPATTTSSSVGGFAAGLVKWIPYAIVGAIALIFVLVIRKK
jgi:hypothetical protein